MRRLRAILQLICMAVLPLVVCGQQQEPTWEITDLSGEGGVEYDFGTGIAVATNGVMVRYGPGVLTAERVIVNQFTGEVIASGNVRVQRDDQVWVSEEVRYNFKTRRFEAQQFRTGTWPIYVTGQGLRAEPLRKGLLDVFKGEGPGEPSVVGALPERLRAKDKAAAAAARELPPYDLDFERAVSIKSSDLNEDGFTTMQELRTLKQAGLADEQILTKMQASGHIFELSREEETLLWSLGMEKLAVEQIPLINAELRQEFEKKSKPASPGEAAPLYAYTATNAVITADDLAEPFLKIRAKNVRIIPGERVVAKGAVLYLGEVPVFWFPYYSRSLDKFSNHFNFVPGYRSTFGPFLLSSYNWFLSDQLDGSLHLDYRVKRGVGVGPDLNYHLGRWGEGTVRYYYLNDQSPDEDIEDADNPQNRQRLYFSYLAEPWNDLSIRSMVRYQGDTNIVREFFESEYRENPQPSTYVEVNKYWRNYSLDIYTQPRVNDFLETVERLPDVTFKGFLQQVGSLPLYYQSESSAGYYRRLFAETNSEPTGLNYSAARFDTYHQFTSPHTLFGWLRFTPRVGGRLTYYTEATGPGGITDEQTRGVFNTGAELSFKASRLWPGVQNRIFDLDGLRHIVEPSVNYVFVPEPSVAPDELPKFDQELPSFRLLPIELPDYHAIDSIDSRSVFRLGLRNKLQTKRQGELVTLANWDLYTDWRLERQDYQTRFADLYSDLVLRPRSWLTLESITRYETDDAQWRMAYHTFTLQPNQTWSWGIGHFYLRDDFSEDPTALGEGNNLITSTIFYRVNENWGFRAHHRFDYDGGKMQEQSYTVYRDLRSWTAALTLRLRDNPTGPNDVTVAFTFSLKAFPRYALGSDALRHYTLWGY